MNSSAVIFHQQSYAVPLESLKSVASLVDETDLELLPFFEEEARAELKKIEAILHAWHAASDDSPVEQLRIRLHTLKGAANSIGQLRIGALAGGLKDVLDSFGAVNVHALRPEVTKVCLTVLDAVKVLMDEARLPQQNLLQNELLTKVVRNILELKKKADELKTL